ncbi:MAG: YraN family protein [candidate division WOR-3 bacterium]
MNYRDKGEEIAARYLKNKGYKILASNFIGKGFEIDLVVKKKNTIAFVEVKRRKSSCFMHPLEAIGRKKKEHLIKGAKFFLSLNDLYDKCDTRFDLLVIIEDKKDIEYYEDAFRINSDF